jgi:glutathione S-transferase
MNDQHMIFLSMPGLRPGDVTRERTPTLHDWANRGVLAELAPTFPCVTSTVQASMWTGVGPEQHGVIANGFYYRDRRAVEFWVARNGIIGGEQIWEAIKSRRPGLRSALWHAQNIKDAAADFIVTPAPIHEPDGTTKLWCYSKPDGLYQQLVDEFGHFPLQHYWGPLANIESTRWILNAAHWLVERHAPHFHWVYVPHLDYAAQKYGPNSAQAQAALPEVDRLLADFQGRVAQTVIGQSVTYVVAGEYALTDVDGVVYPNRLLREAGLLSVRDEDGAELIDFEKSDAFAMVDHQLAHIFVAGATEEKRRRCVEQVVALFRDVPGVDGVYGGRDRRAVGIDHERAGDVVLISRDTGWFAYYWWNDDAMAPAFARTVDIHRKPGYDPVELFVEAERRCIPLDATLVRGSHGVPAKETRHRTALLCSSPGGVIEANHVYRDTDIKGLILNWLTGR